MSKIKTLYESPLLTAAIVSDTHIDIKHPIPKVPMHFLRCALDDSENALRETDVFLTIGDTTSRGNRVNWDLTRKCFNGKHPAKNIIFTIGNHDCWNDDGYDAAVLEYYAAQTDICGKTYGSPYFSDSVNGYKFIFMGNEAESGCGAVISERQIEWLRCELEDGAKDGKPVFVFCHQSINQKHGLPRTWDRIEKPGLPVWEGGIGDSSDTVLALLKEYKNVYYFSGHSHMGFAGTRTAQTEGYSSFESDGGVEFINLPSTACGNHHGEDNSMGCGVQLEVYSDKVVIRPRNYALGKFNKRVIIKDGKPYFEKEIEK